MVKGYDRNDPRWRFEERVQNHIRKHGRTRKEAEEMVDNVIKEKELEPQKTDES